MAKNAWYRNALDPSGGYIVQNGGAVLGDKAGAVLADPAVNGLFTGGSTMYLHEELAFTSMRKLFNVLGHELVHVSQYAALAGMPADYFGKHQVPLMEYYASKFTNSLFAGNYIDNPFPANVPNWYNHQILNYQTFSWTSQIINPYRIEFPRFLKLFH